MTRDHALEIIETKWWEGKSDYEICLFQLFEDRLCMPFDRFHEAVTKCLGRSVFTHEFADFSALQNEFLGDREPPTMEEIMAMIPEEKRLIVVVEADDDA